MQLIEKIRTSYARIGQETYDSARILAYRDFVRLVQSAKPTPQEIAEVSLQGSSALSAIDAGFAQETHYEDERDSTATTRWTEGRSDRMFARTGTLVIANASHILAVRGYAQPEGEESDDYLGLINVARATLCYQAGARVEEAADIEYAAAIDAHAHTLELTQQIAFAATPARNGEIYVAGAAGIKPSEFALLHLDESLSGLVADNRARQLSGFFGRMAAVSALSNLTNEQLVQENISARSLSENLHSLISADVNVH